MLSRVTVFTTEPCGYCRTAKALLQKRNIPYEEINLSKDADGRAELVETQSDAKVKTVRALLRFSYAQPSEIRWVQEKGDTKSLVGWWALEDLGGGRTRATYALEADPGRMLGMLLRGPVEGQVRNFLLGGAAEGLKQKAEAG